MSLLSKLTRSQKEFWSRAVSFHGRTRRKPFWIQLGTATLVLIALLFINNLVTSISALASSQFPSLALGGTIISSATTLVFVAYVLAFLVAITSLRIRRLRDALGSGWWILVSLIPFLGSLILVCMYVQPSLA